MRRHARDQLLHGERLGQIVIRSHVEAEQLVALLDARRQHQDRDLLRVVVLPELAGDREAVDVGQVQVEDHEVVRLLLDRFDRPKTRNEVIHLPAVLAEVQPNRVGDVGVVLDESDPPATQSVR